MASDVLWVPSGDRAANIDRFADWLTARTGERFADYQDLWRFSTERPAAFWGAVWEHCGLGGAVPEDRVLPEAAMPGATWFPDERLNWAEAVLAAPGMADTDTVVKAYSDTRETFEWSLARLRAEVARLHTGLLDAGVTRGDRVAAWMPNVPETYALALAAAAIGAVFTSCAPEFGARAVIDRLRQVEPAILFVTDGYRYGRKEVSRAEDIAQVVAALSAERVVTFPYLDDGTVAGERWDTFASAPGELAFAPVPFDHPLFLLYSSGTTGLPKAIVHSHGGIALEHAKMHGLHHDLGPGDRFFWYSTTGWMMWNYLASAPIVGASIVTFDGAPDPEGLWKLVEDSGATYFGTSAPFLTACRDRGVVPKAIADLTRLHGIGSTGAPLPASGFDYVYESVSATAQLQSLSGGTDLCTGFVGGAPTVPVRRGELSCLCLGAKVESYDANGKHAIGREGELVITAPMPSMPVGLWGDEDGKRYREAYFDAFPGVWCHGDWITITDHGSAVISGRSDATLNRGGVRMGTAEFYAVVESVAGVADSLVVHLDEQDRLIVFVEPESGLDDDLRRQINARIRSELSPRHVPDDVIAVPKIPRTLTGKKLEVPVKRLLNGAPVHEVVSKGALADPAALDVFEGILDR
ncbi:acetoacetate--CoA ligase [Glycomyces sp. NPDC048151]|uniref:acetoacetate--CoA ligase n=1 Tax=Glycomyces sp. NPDC048151 TaxID=3364002 RepID=UPI00371EDEA3